MTRRSDDDRWASVLADVERALRAANLDLDLGDGLLAAVRAALEQLELGPDAATPSPGPHLRVVPHPEPTSAPPPPSNLRVLSLEELTRSLGVPPARSLQLGAIEVEPGEWQTVFRGEHPRAYRLHCTEGKLEVALDGIRADAIKKGQTLDAAARLIRVHCPAGTGRGLFHNLDP